MGLVNFLTAHRNWGIKRGEIVIDIGAGNNPILRANILVDKYVKTDIERYSGIIIDRPFVNADGEALPFKDKSIDFVYCSHVLEHIPNPEVFLSEIQRVGKRGLIVTPRGDFEKLDPRRMHLWYISNLDEKLVLVQKQQWDEFPEISRYFYKITAMKDFQKLYTRNFDYFNTAYHWEDKIHFEIIRNGEFDFSKFTMGFNQDDSEHRVALKIPLKFRAKSVIGKIAKTILS